MITNQRKTNTKGPPAIKYQVKIIQKKPAKEERNKATAATNH